MARFFSAVFICVLLLTASAVGDKSATGDGGEGIGRSEVRVEPKTGEQKFQFQAEVNRLMDIIINSLYSNKDIFLRELISNASDALDKIRYLAITDSKQLGEEEDDSKLEVRVRANKAANTLEIIDSGIGMTREDLIKNLGTIAKSGTKSFLEKAAQNKADSSNLIGQFGVGFYSAYLVADRVTVTSKHNNDKQYVWESGAEQTFTIYEDVDGEPLGRGTKITLHMKSDASEYLDEWKIEDLVRKYSQFINFPIFLHHEEKIEIKEPESEEAADKESGKEADADAKPEDDAAEKPEEEEKKDAEDEDIKVEDDDESKDSKKEEKKKEPKYRTEYSWKLINENKPIWTRDPSDVTEEEYKSFYDGISRMPGKPMARSHFRGEGDVEFRSLLYIPDKPPVGLYGHEEHEKNAIKLFVRRVLVSEKFEMSLLPRYLGFLVGIVDSDDLPINVSREMLQQSKTLDIIRRKLIRKALEMIKSLMQQDEEGDEKNDDDESKEEDEKKEEEKEEDDDTDKKPKKNRYLKFWSQYGKSIKLGVVEDRSNRARLAKLLRFRTSRTNTTDENDWASLDDYLERMKKDQDQIYYLSGESLEVIEKSPFLEKILSKGYEVIYLYEPIDEHMIMNLPDYEGSKFMSVAKDNFKFGDKDQKEEKEKTDSLKKAFKPLTKYLKSALGDKVSKVKLSTRLSKTPCVLSTEQFGYSARMEIIMKAQAFADPDSYSYMTPKAKIMELNPHHPIVKEMLTLITKDEKDTNKRVEELGHLVYDTALVSSGYLMRDNDEFAKRMYKFIGESLSVDTTGPILEDFSKAEKIEKKEEKVEKKEEKKDVNEEIKKAMEENTHDEL